MQSMTEHWKYAGRYGYPDPGLNQAIAEYDGVKPENIMITAGSGEVLDVVGTTFLQNGKKVLGVEPSYGSVYQHATSIKSDAIKLPLTKDYRQDIGMIIDAAQEAPGRARVRLYLQPEQPDRHDRHQAGNQAAARRTAGRHAGADRRGLSPLRRRSELRDGDALRQRRTSGDRRAHVLEDRRDGGDARRLRGRRRRH